MKDGYALERRTVIEESGVIWLWNQPGYYMPVTGNGYTTMHYRDTDLVLARRMRIAHKLVYKGSTPRGVTQGADLYQGNVVSVGILPDVDLDTAPDWLLALTDERNQK